MFYNASFSQKSVTVKLWRDQSITRFNGERVEYTIEDDILPVFYAIIFLALRKKLGENLKRVYVRDGEVKFVYDKSLQNPIDLSGLTEAYYGCCVDCTIQRIYKRMTEEDYTPEVDRQHEFLSRVLEDLGYFMSI